MQRDRSYNPPKMKALPPARKRFASQWSAGSLARPKVGNRIEPALPRKATLFSAFNSLSVPHPRKSTYICSSSFFAPLRQILIGCPSRRLVRHSFSDGGRLGEGGSIRSSYSVGLAELDPLAIFFAPFVPFCGYSRTSPE